MKDYLAKLVDAARAKYHGPAAPEPAPTIQPPPVYDEAAISAAQANWRAQDLRTFNKRDEASMAERHNALLDLLCAHVPTNKEAP